MRFEELTRDELYKIAPLGIAIIPCGAIEQHGPHLAVGADTLFVTQVCHEAAKLAPANCNVVVLPPVAYGISDHHKPHPGVMSLSPQTFMSVLMELGKCVIEGGFPIVFFVNGHNGNEDAIKIVARQLNNLYDRTIVATSYWTTGWDQLTAGGVVDGVARIPGHAGKFETSMMMFLDSALVRNERIPVSLSAPVNAHQSVKAAVFPKGGKHGLGAGYSDAPAEASEGLGALAFAACAEGLADLISKLTIDLRKV